MSRGGGFRDNFSAVADRYARSRPTYPDALFAWLAAAAPARESAWDCACGSGQATLGLAAHFDSVYATDASAAQVARALARDNIGYWVGTVEHTDFDDDSFDLVLAAQAVHWFDIGAFFDEVRRVGRCGGIVALVAYELHRVTPEIDAVTDALYEPVLGPYWQPQRRHIKAGYRVMPFPFEELEAPAIDMTADWTAEDCLDYLQTWSAVSRCRAETGKDPLTDFAVALRAAWGEGARTVRWPLILRAGRIPG